MSLFLPVISNTCGENLECSCNFSLSAASRTDRAQRYVSQFGLALFSVNLLATNKLNGAFLLFHDLQGNKCFYSPYRVWSRPGDFKV